MKNNTADLASDERLLGLSKASNLEIRLVKVKRGIKPSAVPMESVRSEQKSTAYLPTFSFLEDLASL